MPKEKSVVVAVPYKSLFHEGEKVWATRLRALGLTAYGDTSEESVRKVKKMFSAFVNTHRELGTLAERLDESGLFWCWESDYTGDMEAEWVEPCEKHQGNTWKTMGELVVA